jgi:hypothetical protein
MKEDQNDDVEVWYRTERKKKREKNLFLCVCFRVFLRAVEDLPKHTLVDLSTGMTITYLLL